jgi:radical SAM superfamily enzyme YgiQ (UPF0313 family)
LKVLTEKLKIYLGDLTYDTIVLANDVFPLNIGFVASYTLNKFKEFVDITLFKYIDDLEKAVIESPPDILGLSNYCWNERIGYEMFKIAKDSNPNILTVSGGPNFPVDIPSQEYFMSSHPEIMFYVPIEGEIGFLNIVERVLSAESKEKIVEMALKEPIEGVISRKKDKTLQYLNPITRIKKLDEVPSPYTTGLLDKFFNSELNPMIQTNRGCPFSCSFCVDGNDDVRQVNQFSIQRIRDELNYIGIRIPENKNLLYISDLNFGMYSKDIEVCDIIAQIQQNYGYPKRIIVSTGKNQKERIIDAIKRLNGALRFLIAVQSTNSTVLTNIKRDNISIDHMMALAPAIRSENLRTSSEVIVGLPGDTYETNMDTIRDLLRAQIDDIQVYTLMLLKGSELGTPHEREKWNFKTKFRVLSKDFAKLGNGKNVIEIEEVVVGSNSLSFDDYVKIRVMAFIVWVTNIGIVYDAILKYIRQKKIDTFELFDRMIKNYNIEKNVNSVIDGYKKATINELWDSPEEIEKYYQDNDAYAKLLDEREGFNVIQYHQAIVISKLMKEWTEFTISQAKVLLDEYGFTDKQTKIELHDIANYCHGLSHGVLEEDRLTTNPSFDFLYDIQKWLNDKTERPISDFSFEASTKIFFALELIQYKTVQNGLEAFPKTNVGLSQAFKSFPIQMLWRIPHTSIP